MFRQDHPRFYRSVNEVDPMMIKATVVTATLLSSLSTMASAQSYYTYDSAGREQFVIQSGSGRVQAYDQSGNYSYGNPGAYGNTYLYGQDGNGSSIPGRGY